MAAQQTTQPKPSVLEETHNAIGLTNSSFGIQPNMIDEMETEANRVAEMNHVSEKAYIIV